MSNADYIDEKMGRVHAPAREMPARPQTPAPPEDEETAPASLAAPIQMEALELRSELDRIAEEHGGVGGRGLFFGINNHELSPNGTRVTGSAPLLVALDEDGWKKMLATCASLGMECKLIKTDDDTAVSRLGDKGDNLCTVTYWGLQLLDNAAGEGNGDPRANLLPAALSNLTFKWPYVYIYAHVREVNKADAVECDTAPCEAPAGVASPLQIRPGNMGMKKGFLDGKTTHPEKKEWYAPASAEGVPTDPAPSWVSAARPDAAEAADYPDGSAATFRSEAAQLQLRAKQLAELGDNKSAYTLVADAMQLMIKAETADKQSVVRKARAAPPPSDEPKVFKTEVEYAYPDGTKRTIPGGWYTESEWLTLSMEEQELWAAVMQAAERDARTTEVASLGKYESPLTRTPSAAESMTHAEALGTDVANNSRLKRGIMASVSSSKESTPGASPVASPVASPDATPTVTPLAPPELPSYSADALPGSVIDAIGNIDVSDGFAATMDEMGMTDAQKDYYEFS